MPAFSVRLPGPVIERKANDVRDEKALLQPPYVSGLRAPVCGFQFEAQERASSIYAWTSSVARTGRRTDSGWLLFWIDVVVNADDDDGDDDDESVSFFDCCNGMTESNEQSQQPPS